MHFSSIFYENLTGSSKMGKNKLLHLLFRLVLCILLLELVLRIIFYQQVGKNTFAVVETLSRIHLKMIAPKAEDLHKAYSIVRPDSTEEVNKLIAKEFIASNALEYAPWVEYKNIDFEGRYINVNQLKRASNPDQFINSLSTDTVVIYFFGGSTMFGINATDGETIPAAFVRLYQQLYPAGRSIKVVNYAVPAYYSYNELILLSQLIYAGKKPHLAIFLDGLNDFLIINAAQNRLPYYYYQLKLMTGGGVNLKKFAAIGDSTESLFAMKPGSSFRAVTDSLLQNFFSNKYYIEQLANANRISAFFFIQPNPYYNYPNKKNDPFCDQQGSGVIDLAYPELEKKADSSGNYFFLGNMLHNEKGYPFIDRFHYSAGMSYKIAQEMVRVIGNKINVERE